MRLSAAWAMAVVGLAATVAAQPDNGRILPGRVDVREVATPPTGMAPAPSPARSRLIFNPYGQPREVIRHFEARALRSPQSMADDPDPNPYLDPPFENPYALSPHPGAELEPFFNPYTGSVGRRARALARPRARLAGADAPTANPYQDRRAADPDFNPYLP